MPNEMAIMDPTTIPAGRFLVSSIVIATGYRPTLESPVAGATSATHPIADAEVFSQEGEVRRCRAGQHRPVADSHAC